VCAEKMTTEVGESTNMHYMTNRLARDQSCKAAGKCMNPYCSLYDCYEKNDKPLCKGETKNVANTPKEAKIGIHHNIKETVITRNGWTQRLREMYGTQHSRDMRTIINNWNTHNLWMFIAAQHVKDFGNDYYMGAFAPTKRVFQRCGNSRHCGYRTLPASDCIHGAYWYCVTNWSFGFSARNQIRLCSADTYGVWGGYDPGHSSNHRLSWHMHYWYTAGWRAGYVHNLNGERNVYKLVFTKQCNGCGTVPTNYPTGFPTAYPTAFPTRFPTAYPTRYPTRYPTSYPTRYPTPAACATCKFVKTSEADLRKCTEAGKEAYKNGAKHHVCPKGRIAVTHAKAHTQTHTLKRCYHNSATGVCKCDCEDKLF